ncbi:MAG: hypothetical protein ABIH46_05985 [Chloroflexota bacterium]
MDHFKAYRLAYDAMEADPIVLTARAILKIDQAAVGNAEAVYREAMTEHGQQITAAVLENGKSVTMHDVEAKYTKGRVTPSWKSIASLWMPSDKLVAEHSTVGKPSVSVRVK